MSVDGIKLESIQVAASYTEREKRASYTDGTEGQQTNYKIENKDEFN